MYFVIIMAFALVLSDNLPPEACNLFRSYPFHSPTAIWGTLAIVLGQIVLVGCYAGIQRRRTSRHFDGTPFGHDAAVDAYGRFQDSLLFVLAGFLVLSIVCTPWVQIVRVLWGLGRFALVGDLVILAPLFASLTVVWIIGYGVELRLRAEAAIADQSRGHSGEAAPMHETPIAHESAAASKSPSDAVIALRDSALSRSTPRIGLPAHLSDKFRHQVLILAAPMCIILVAKFLIHEYGPRLVTLPPDALMRDIILNSALGLVSVLVLVVSPWLLRYTWSTEPLPNGPLRDRFEKICKRIGLRYREILLWHTHGATVNAAVMGFVAPLRFILVSDALLESMDDEEIEAVFAHEAGHVQHWHLPFFGVFTVVSMYVAGGVMHLLFWIDHLMGERVEIDNAMLQLSALTSLLLMWLFGFAWLSRKFERQADLYGVRCITPDIESCVPACPVHGKVARRGICVAAANLFGRTLARIADLNGIPRDAPSWRHGSIESRCRLIETFVADEGALRQFDRKILRIKIGLVVCAVVGSVIAVAIYHGPVMAALARMNARGISPGGL
ncbi:MAG: M48 family metalloprotease [Phycisphaerae bacterium]|nr:M48 family metalloprotease [Phycisphaerae bacterium]